jgi:hypothetical protein
MDESNFTESNRRWEQVKAVLSTSPIFNLRNLEIEQSGNSLILTGQVHSYYEKQQAQELTRSTSIPQTIRVSNLVPGDDLPLQPSLWTTPVF